MSRTALWTLLLCAPVALAGQPFALELRGGPSILSGPESLRVEYLGDNDSLGWATNGATGLPYDRWYSTSTKLLLRWPVKPSWLPADSRLLLSTSLGQNIYTPRSAYVETVEELAGDRPYSGWFSASFGAEWVTGAAPLAFARTDRAYSHLGLEVFAGGLGPYSFAGNVQHTAHHAYLLFQGQQMPEVRGWGLAETQPGFTADVSAFAETTLAVTDVAPPDWMSWSTGRPAVYWIAGARGDVGSTLTAGALSTTVLGGWVGDPLARSTGLVPTTLYLYARGEVRYVGWNATIEAPLVTGDVVARRQPLVYEVAVGAVARIWKGEFGYSQIYRSNEVASLPEELRTGQLIGQWSYTFVW